MFLHFAVAGEFPRVPESSNHRDSGDVGRLLALGEQQQSGREREATTSPLATGQLLRVQVWAPNHRTWSFGFAAVIVQTAGAVPAQPNPVPPLGILLQRTEVPPSLAGFMCMLSGGNSESLPPSLPGHPPELCLLLCVFQGATAGRHSEAECLECRRRPADLPGDGIMGHLVCGSSLRFCAFR